MRNLLKYKVFKAICAIALLLMLPAVESNDAVNQTGSRSYFGVLLSTSSMGNDMIYAIFTEGPSGISHKFITRQEFVNIAQGKWKLRPNIKQENLFEKYGIVWGIDEDRELIHVPILDSLWKIRYRQFPYLRGTTGWANDVYMPSAAQQIYLSENFGIQNINTDFFRDTNFWKLLQSAQSEIWRLEYKALFD